MNTRSLPPDDSADRFAVFVMDKQKRELTTRTASGVEINVPVDSGIVGYVASTGEEAVVADAYKDPRFNETVDKKVSACAPARLCLAMGRCAGRCGGWVIA